jgi:hypothetical protein
MKEILRIICAIALAFIITKTVISMRENGKMIRGLVEVEFSNLMALRCPECLLMTKLMGTLNSRTR